MPRTLVMGTILLFAEALLAAATEIPLPPDFFPKNMTYERYFNNNVEARTFQIAAGGDRILYAVRPVSPDEIASFRWMVFDVKSRKTSRLIDLVPGLKEDSELLVSLPKTPYLLCRGDHEAHGRGLFRIELRDGKARRIDSDGSCFFRAGSSVAVSTYKNHAWGSVRLVDLESEIVRELPVHGVVSGASEDGKMLLVSANPNDLEDGSQKSWGPLLLTSTGRLQADLSGGSTIKKAPGISLLHEPVVSPTGKWVAGTIPRDPYTVVVIGPDLKGYSIERKLGMPNAIGVAKVIAVLDDGTLLANEVLGDEDKTGGDVVIFRRDGTRETICRMPAAAEVWGGNLYMLFLGDKPVLRILPIQGLKGSPRN